MQKREAINGVILAGGRSSRFGTNKALSMFKGERLIERLVRSLGQVTQSLFLVTNTPEAYPFLNLPTGKDLIPDCGPLGGIYTALKSIETPLCLCIACDMPFVHPNFMAYMIQTTTSYDVVVPMNGQREEPLCAVYRTTCIPAIEERIQAKRYKMIGFYDQVRVKRITASDTDHYNTDMFFNVNTPGDYEEALRRLEGKGKSAQG